MKVSDYIARFLRENGCGCVFGYPGGAVTHLIDSLYGTDGVRFIGTYHEQAAAFAAEGYARRKNGPGAALATSGPGAVNLLTGIGSAYFDSVPVLYLTGQVNTYEYKNDLRVRQLGFQETDIVSMAKPVTKYAVRVTDPRDIRFELEKALCVACSGRKGPVLLDLPMDVQRAEVEEGELAGFSEGAPHKARFSVGEAIRLLNGSRRPVFLAGGGVRLSEGAPELLQDVAEKLGVPVVCSLMGRDSFDNGSECYMGMLGTYGNRCANFTAANSDLVVALGSRLDTRQTGTVPESFARGAKLVRVEIDPAELSHKIKPDEIAVRADAGAFLEKLSAAADRIHADWNEWRKTVLDYRKRYPLFQGCGWGGPNSIVNSVSRMLPEGGTAVLDVGQNQMWGAQSFLVTGGRRLLISGGMGAMGFSLPCAVGAHYAGGGKVFAFTGDGGMQMNLQELELLKRNGLPVKVIVLNNRNLGMIRQFQEMYFGGRCNATVRDYEAPCFTKIAEAYGIESLRVENGTDFTKLGRFLSAPGPGLAEIALPQDTAVVPKLGVGMPIEDQEPPLAREEFLSNMIVEPYDPGEGRGDF